MPPALSVIGPKESIATMMPAIDSIAIGGDGDAVEAAEAIAARSRSPITSTGSAVAIMPIARPAMMLVACR